MEKQIQDNLLNLTVWSSPKNLAEKAEEKQRSYYHLEKLVKIRGKSGK